MPCSGRLLLLQQVMCRPQAGQPIQQGDTHAPLYHLVTLLTDVYFLRAQHPGILVEWHDRLENSTKSFSRLSFAPFL